MQKILIHLFGHHLLLFVFLGILGGFLWKDWKLALFTGSFSYLLDLDHFLEYLWWSKGNFDFKEFLRGKYFKKKGTIWVIFHAWEYTVVFATLWFASKNPTFGAVFIGMLGHLILDQLSWSLNPLSYFLTYRFLVKAKIENICRD